MLIKLSSSNNRCQENGVIIVAKEVAVVIIVVNIVDAITTEILLLGLSDHIFFNMSES